MSKAVLISIRPKWCQLIAIEEKTVEIRKTRPKLETPFKVYIYATKAAKDEPFSYTVQKNYDAPGEKTYRYSCGGEVIGEFVCDKIDDIMISCSEPNMRGIPFPETGLTDREIMDYLGNGKTGFSWHISDLVTSVEPKKLSEFNLKRPPQSWCYIEEMEE